MPGRTMPRRAELTVMLAMIMATGALGIDLMLPAFSQIREAFGLPSDSTAVAGIVTAYFMGLAAGQLVFGALADRYGRKRALTVGLVMYGASAAAAAMAPSLTVLLVARFVWGFAASGPRVVAVTVVRDLFDGDRMAQAMSYVMAVFLLVPVVAPTLGAGVLALSNWQWVFGVCVVFAVVMLVWTRRLPETLDPERRRENGWSGFGQAAKLVVTNRTTMAYTLAITALFASFSSYLASSELIVSEVLGRANTFPFVFGFLSVIMGTAMVANGTIVRRVGSMQMARKASIAYVIWSTLIAAGSVASGGTPSLAIFILGVAPILALHAVIFPNLNTAAMQPMRAIAGTASAVIGTISTALGALLGAVIDNTFDGTTTPLAIGFALSGIATLGFTLWGSRAEPENPVSRGGHHRGMSRMES